MKADELGYLIEIFLDYFIAYANEFAGFFFAVTQILIVFVRMFKKSREENERQADAEKKKIEKEAMKERSSVKAKWDHIMFFVEKKVVCQISLMD